MARSSYIINPPTTGGGGATTEDHDHSSLYYTQSQSDARFINLSGDSLLGPLDWNASSGSNRVIGSKVDGDLFDRITITASGQITFGPGGTAGDVTFGRSALDELTVGGSLVVDGSLTVAGTINTTGALDADTVGGYGPAFLISRTNHTGTQLASTISDFAEAVSDQIGTMVSGNTETGISVVYQDSDNTLDFTVSYGTAVGLSNVSTNSAGSGSTSARANHTHAITGFLPLGGGTLTGALTLNANPTTALGAATKQYVDAHTYAHNHSDQYYTETEIDTILGSYSTTAQNNSTFLKLSGGTLTGPVVLPGDPVADLQAATKQYVDDATAPHSHDNFYYTETEIDTLLSNKSDITHHHDTVYLQISGGTLSGSLILAGDPVDPLGAASKQYVDDSISTHNHDGAYYTETEVDSLLSGKSDTTHNHNATYLQLTGGTLSGSLILAADPTTPLEAASKQYVDANTPEINTANIMGYTEHGTDANALRPVTDGAVIWVGQVEPLNKQAGDFWFYPNGATLEPEPVVFGAYGEEVVEIPNATGTVTLDCSLGNVFKVNRTGNVTFNIINPWGTCHSITLVDIQDATGGRTTAFSNTFRWPNGVMPTPSTAASTVNIWALSTVNTGTSWYGFLSGKGMA